MQPIDVLNQYWGYNSFRPKQEEIVNAVLNGHDVLALLPTGGGKSICFQVPALCMPGLCIVITPLIALMKDQVANLLKRNIAAATIHTGMGQREAGEIIDKCINGTVKFLYLSPERLLSETFRMALIQMNVGLIAVDEAHCISQWGYDFRPPYLKIAELRSVLPHCSVIALTASATREVADDIQQKLLFKKQSLYRSGFERKNLNYLVYKEDDKLKKLVKIISNVPGTSIVYVRNRRRTKEISDYLNSNGISSGFYHAGLEAHVRSQRQDEWLMGKIKVIVATNAFGMGIDKPDVRTVVHMDVPNNLEEYYQESGRGGRDERTAYAVLLYNQTDITDINGRLDIAFPPLSQIRLIYKALCNFLQIPLSSGEGTTYNFNIGNFSNSYNLHALQVTASIKILELEGILTLTDAATINSRIKITMAYTDFYNFQVLNPQYDFLLKTMLRSYEGLFDNYVHIDEALMATRSGEDINQVVATLKYLHKMQVIEYFPQTSEPQLTFLKERIKESDLELNPEVYSNRKERFSNRLNSMLNYVTNEHTCRVVMLLDYFNETNLYRCGICDYCRRRNKVALNDVEFDNLLNSVKSILSKQSTGLNELVEKLGGNDEHKTIEAIRWIIDNGIIFYDEQNRLHLKN